MAVWCQGTHRYFVGEEPLWSVICRRTQETCKSFPSHSSLCANVTYICACKSRARDGVWGGHRKWKEKIRGKTWRGAWSLAPATLPMFCSISAERAKRNERNLCFHRWPRLEGFSAACIECSVFLTTKSFSLSYMTYWSPLWWPLVAFWKPGKI